MTLIPKNRPAKLSRAECTLPANQNAEVVDARSMQPQGDRLRRATEAILENRPPIWEREFRRIIDKFNKRQLQANLKSLEQQAALLEAARCEADKIAIETRLHQLDQAANMQRQGVANAAYSTALAITSDRIRNLQSYRDILPDEFLQTERKRALREASGNLREISERAKRGR